MKKSSRTGHGQCPKLVSQREPTNETGDQENRRLFVPNGRRPRRICRAAIVKVVVRGRYRPTHQCGSRGQGAGSGSSACGHTLLLGARGEARTGNKRHDPSDPQRLLHRSSAEHRTPAPVWRRIPHEGVSDKMEMSIVMYLSQ